MVKYLKKPYYYSLLKWSGVNKGWIRKKIK